MPHALFPSHLESERLRYEPLQEVIDVLDLYDLHRSGEMDEVMAPLGERPHPTPKRTLDELARSEAKWTEGTLASYAMFERETDEFVGVAELWLDWEKNRAAFGTWIREGFWGNGYSGERAGVLLYVAFELLGLEVVGVGHEPDNDQSKRAIEKYVERYGGRYDGINRNGLPPGDEGGPRDLHEYSISQAEWRANVPDAELASIRVVA